MPKTVPEYSLCKVYKLVSPQTDKVYIGSTCSKYLSSRLSQHKIDYKRYVAGKYHYVSSFEIVKYDDCNIVLIQSYSDCKNNMEQMSHEQDWIDIYDCVNKFRSYRTLEQKKLYEKEYDKIRYEKEVLNKVKCECGGVYMRRGKVAHKKTKKHQKYIDY
jgi:hypothetical protein